MVITRSKSVAAQEKQRSHKSPIDGALKRQGRQERARASRDAKKMAESQKWRDAAHVSKSAPASVPSMASLCRAAADVLQTMNLGALAAPCVATLLASQLEARFRLTAGALAAYTRLLTRWAMRYVRAPHVQCRMYAAVHGDSVEDRFAATRLYRRLLSLNMENTCVEAEATALGTADMSGPALVAHVLSTGVLERVVQFVGAGHADALRLEAAWLLSNVCYGTEAQTTAAVDAGAVAALVALLRDAPTVQLKEQAVWCLANIAGEGVHVGRVAHSGVLAALEADYVRNNGEAWSRNFAQHTGWLLCNLLRDKDGGPVEEQLLWSLTAVVGFLLKVTDDDETTLAHAAWALQRLAEVRGDVNMRIVMRHPDGVLTVEGLGRLATLMYHTNPKISSPLRYVLRKALSCMGDDVLLFSAMLSRLTHLLAVEGV
jgi:hypothetical protein